MKYIDDYDAKLDIWVREARVYAMPRLANLPRFGHKSFRSHEEMNAWKKELLDRLAESGGARWEKESG
jgi:hypothetical protein